MMTTGEMIRELSEDGSRTDRLEAMLDEYNVHGILELTDEQITRFYQRERSHDEEERRPQL